MVLIQHEMVAMFYLNIKKSKEYQTKTRFRNCTFTNITVFKQTAHLSFDCRLFYPNEMVLTQHYSQY